MVMGRAFSIVVIPLMVFETAPAMVTHQKPTQPGPPHAATQPAAYNAPCTQANWQAKTLDIVLYGATGYTGRLAAKYLAKGLIEKPSWAIAGRNRIKLDELHSELGNKTQNPDVIGMGLKDETKLKRMAEKTKVILNFAGPYEKNDGESLIRAAIENCAHYVDVSTETFWNKLVLKTYGAIAEARGVALVQSAGIASMASDFLAMSALKDAMTATQQLPSAVHIVWTKFNDGNSGGQFETSQYEHKNHGEVSDPYCLSPETPQKNRTDFTLDGMVMYGENRYVNMELTDFNMAHKDAPVIRRSIYATYDRSVSVREAAEKSMQLNRLQFLVSPNISAGNVPIAKKIPTPGEGPPGWVWATGSFAGEATAYVNDTRVQVSIEGHGGPNFFGTPRMAAEMAIGLAFNGPANSKGGYLTPTTALGLDLLEHRLSQVDNGKFITIKHHLSDVPVPVLKRRRKTDTNSNTTPADGASTAPSVRPARPPLATAVDQTNTAPGHRPAGKGPSSDPAAQEFKRWIAYHVYHK